MAKIASIASIASQVEPRGAVKVEKIASIASIASQVEPRGAVKVAKIASIASIASQVVRRVPHCLVSNARIDDLRAACDGHESFAGMVEFNDHAGHAESRTDAPQGVESRRSQGSRAWFSGNVTDGV